MRIHHRYPSNIRSGPERNITLTTITSVFVLVYLGMLLGGLPFLQIDRTGIVLLGTIGLLVSQSIRVDEAARAIHIPTLVLLFAFMVVAAQMQLGGFYRWVTARIGTLHAPPTTLLAAVILTVAALSAVFSNDIVCLSIAPVLIDVCVRRRLDPIPFLLALRCAANIGSAATLIGNPQNILIGGRLALSFVDYIKGAALPVLAGLVLVWLVIVATWRSQWLLDDQTIAGNIIARPATDRLPVVNIWQSIKGLTVAGALFTLFLCSDWPREIVALGGAGILLLSRRLHSRDMLGLVDWSVLILFIGLFIINDAFERTGIPARLVADLAEFGINLQRLAVLIAVTALLSNIVSNVPAIMLLLPHASASDGLLLALSSTFAGNLLIIGSVANIIVMDAALQRGVRITWKQHAIVGVPVTVLTLGLTVVYLFAIAPT
jgi:Na+/H+ antiporter NhaD/arsenite permease-like protein